MKKREKMEKLFGLEVTYEKVLALTKERMGIFGYYPHEIEKAAKAWYKEIVEKKLEKEI